MESERPRLIMVFVGILLFVVGFLVTLAAMNDGAAIASADGNSSDRTTGGATIPDDVYLFSGMLVSLAGVVLATFGPAAAVLKKGS